MQICIYTTTYIDILIHTAFNMYYYTICQEKKMIIDGL